MRPLGVRATTLVVLVYLGAALAVLQGFVGSGLPIQFGAPLVSHVTGMAAGYGAAIMLILMSRSPWLERDVGCPPACALACLGRAAGHHADCRCTPLPQLRPGRRLARIDLFAATKDVLNLPGLVTASVGTVILVLIGFSSLRSVRRRISYERWHFLHLLTYLAVGFGFAHQLAGPDLAGRRWLQIAWALLYTYAFALVLRWRVFQPLFQLWRHRLRVEQVRQEAPDVMSVLMSGQHLDELRAEPGQFFRWRFLTRETWRSAYPFSLSAPPTRQPAANHH